VVTVFEFGDFKLDCDRFELYRAGRSIKLERKPMELLILLAGRNGHLVSRSEIAERLWDREVFVDTEHGINTAIRKIRQVLGDDSEQPRFLLTVTGKGYRFIGTIVEVPQPLLDADVENRPSPGGNSNSGGNGSISINTGAQPGTAAIRDPAQEHTEVPVEREKRNPRYFRQRHLAVRLAAWVGALGAIGVLAFFVANIQAARGWKNRLLGVRATPQIKSLAVLPLQNFSGDPAQDYFADGMTDEMITVLAKDLPVRVISRTSVMQYKNVHRPLPEIARELGVDGILEGSVGRSGNRVHLTAQLIHAPSDTHIWAQSFDRDLSDVGSLQNELAETIARQVGAKTSGSGSPERHISPEAHEAYLLGRYYWFSEDQGKSRGYFQKAIDLQPDYAAAWAGVADSYAVGAVGGEFPPEAVMPQAEAAAKKALELDDLDAQAHLTMAAVQLFYRWNWAAAERESARALELNPNFAEGHHMRSYALRPWNRLDEAVQEERKAIEVDPFARPRALGFALLRAHQLDAALNEARIRVDGQPNDADVHYLLSCAYFYKGMLKESEEESERFLQLSGDKDQLAEQIRAYRQGGFRGVLAWKVDRLQRMAAKQYVPPLDLALGYAQMGRKEETLLYLEKSYRERSPRLVFLQSEPDLDFLHSDPRYRAIVNDMGLPAAYGP
jgi:TolB-like protein/DNA-binding winged helix-turn-helix (wHTH) protein